MNYRHGFHAGSFADVAKHALVAAALERLVAGPGAIYVLDSHGGAGAYDLEGEAARRSGEWRRGIARLAAAAGSAPTALASYLACLGALNGGLGALRRYPGSPALARAILRPGDRLVVCEAEAGEARRLAAWSAGDERVWVRHADGWRALRTFLPPRERRGLVLIDPPFERADEGRRLAAALVQAHRQWPAGTLLGWYPIKTPLAAELLKADVAVPRALAAELWVRPLASAGTLDGTGLIVINPPPGFDALAREILAFLAPVLAEAPGAGWRYGPIRDRA